MTNYNERLYEIIRKLCHDFENRKVDSLQAQVDAKASITPLVKELVAEAKPPTFEPEINSEGDKYLTDTKDGYNRGVTDYEANLLKALEEI